MNYHNYARALCSGILLTLPIISLAQGQQDSMYLKDTVRTTISKFQNLSFSGYIQPQFQLAEEKGTSSFEGGNFAKHADNRFMLRRSRVKIEYNVTSKTSKLPKALFSFQFDATERGVNIRDAFIRWYGPGKREFSITAGLFNRPFGYEVIMSSSVRESPERGRASQILTPGEKDLGAMISFEPKKEKSIFNHFKWDLGFFNGQGTTGPTDFDSYKDLNYRMTIKPIGISKNFFISGGLSQISGGWVKDTKFQYEIGEVSGLKQFVVDSSMDNIGGKAKRNYGGADFQLLWKHKMGRTELRGEHWSGTQSGSATSTVSPGSLPTTANYTRKFDAAFFYFIQNIVNEKWEAVVKYDWYDPNTDISKTDIGKSGSNFTAADIRYNTLGVGLTRHINSNVKVLAYYAMPKNETTALTGFTSDLEDNVFTLRMQLKF